MLGRIRVMINKIEVLTRDIKMKLTHTFVFLIVSSFAAVSLPVQAQDDAVQDEDRSASPPKHRSYKLNDEQRAEMRDKMRQHRKQMAEKRLQELDQNGDELVDRNEYLAHAESRFNELDADNDGYVTREEARMHHKTLRKKHRLKRQEFRKGVREDAETFN